MISLRRLGSMLLGVCLRVRRPAWKGEVYVPQFDSYKNVTITMPDEQTLKMTVKFGFIRRSVEWSRVDSIEAVPPLSEHSLNIINVMVFCSRLVTNSERELSSTVEPVIL